MASASIIQHATDAIQAQERLLWQLESGSHVTREVKAQAYASLETLSLQKALLEGSNFDFKYPQVVEGKMVELKQLTLMHVPASVTPEAQRRFRSLVEQVMTGICKSVISITLLTCPWYELSQKERGEQAKHNILMIIYLSDDSQFFAPVNHHVTERAFGVDCGWFCAVELSHFGAALCRGRTRYLEALYCRQGAEIYASQEWLGLRLSLSCQTITATRGFLNACLGQAVGGLAKQGKTGSMKLKGSAGIYEICESFRLLQLAHNTLSLQAKYAEILEDKLPSVATNAVEKVKAYYDHPDQQKCKQQLFDLLMSWLGDLKVVYSDLSVGPLLKTNHTQAEQVIGKWLMSTRLQNRTIRPCPVVGDEHTHLLELMGTVGGPVKKMQPEQILLVAVAGSAMYNLSTLSSDVDYLVIYRIPTEVLLSATAKLVDSHENRGVNKSVEYGAYEAHKFCEMLLKCSVVILELLFVDGHEYMSPLWQAIAWLGGWPVPFLTADNLAKTNTLVPISGGWVNTGNFHKIIGVQQMMKGEEPPVRVQGDTRDYIMSVRTQYQGKWSRESILEELNKQYTELRENLSTRNCRLREKPDYQLCLKWLLSVRGLL